MTKPHNLFGTSAQIGQLFWIFLKKALIKCPFSMLWDLFSRNIGWILSVNAVSIFCEDEGVLRLQKGFSPLSSKDATQELLNSYLVYYKSWTTMGSKIYSNALAFSKGMIFNYFRTITCFLSWIPTCFLKGDIYMLL